MECVPASETLHETSETNIISMFIIDVDLVSQMPNQVAVRKRAKRRPSSELLRAAQMRCTCQHVYNFLNTTHA